MKKHHQKRSNFTLIEIVTVIIILALLAGIATPLYWRYVKNAKITTAKTQIKMLEQAIYDFKLDMGSLPDSVTGLKALVENAGKEKKWDGPYLKSLPKDPWGREYLYIIPGQHGEFDIITYGSDGIAGGEKEAADIGNWE
jgi:general secretion pathway protein G